MAFSQTEPRKRIELSRRELSDISRIISRDFSPYFMGYLAGMGGSAHFSSQELLSIAEEIRRDFTPVAADGRSNLVLMPIDPQHLHAYWRFTGNVGKVAAESAQPPGLRLRIFKDGVALRGSPTELPWMDIDISGMSGSLQVDLPENDPAAAYMAAIGVLQDEHHEYKFTEMVRSNRVEMPNSPCRTTHGLLPAALNRYLRTGTVESSRLGHPLTLQS